jgi:Tfp pilus assembly protein PilF
MGGPVPDYPDDVTVYLVVNDFGKFGKAYVETDTAEAHREVIIRNLISGQYSKPLRVVAFNTGECWSRDVSEDIANEVLERAFDADDNLSEDTKRFVDRHVTAGEKRPPAPSVRRGDHQALRKKA